MTTLTVTATQQGGTFAGLAMRVKVLTGAKAAASQTGGHNHKEVTSPNQVSVTTTQTGSLVYAGINQEQTTTWTAVTGCTVGDQFNDVPNGQQYGWVRTTSATGTPGATTVGLSSTASGFENIAAAEILTTGTITEDASGPAFVSTNSAITVTTASFTPPAGSLLVAVIGSDGASDFVTPTTMSVTDTAGLSWTALSESISSAAGYAGVWVADIPGSSSTPGRSLVVGQAVKRSAFY